MKQLTEASAPGKLMLFGEHAVVYDWPCIVTAVDQRLKVKAGFGEPGKVIIRAPQLGLEEFVYDFRQPVTEIPKEASFILATLDCLGLEERIVENGLEIWTESDFSQNYGLGSSSAVTVATAKAVMSLYDLSCRDKKMFRQCFQAVLAVQGVGSGFDLAAALWGGTIVYQKQKGLIKAFTAKKIPLLVCYTGVKADTKTLVNRVADLREKNQKKIDKIFEKISLITKKAQLALEQEDWLLLGKLMNQNQVFLKKLEVSTRKIEMLIRTALEHGAWGGKLSGAGGGDNIILLVPEEKRLIVSRVLEQRGGKILNINFHAKGVL